LLALLLVQWFYSEERKGHNREIRRLPALDAVEEMVGRSVEMGRPVHFTAGENRGGLAGVYVTGGIAGINLYGFVCEQTAKHGARILCSVATPDMHPLHVDVARHAYLAEGKPEEFNEDDIYLFPGRSYRPATIGVILKEKPAVNIMVGSFWGEAILIAEAASRVGAVNIGGTIRHIQIPYLAAMCEYVLIGEELYAIQAYYTKDPMQVASMSTEDVLKLIGIGLGVIGLIAISAGSTVIKDLIAL
jgi:hypothetical protein